MKKSKVNLTLGQKEKIIDLYVNKHKGQLYCAKAVGHSDISIVKKVLKEYGIEIRDYSTAAALSNENRVKYNINHEYFKTESSNMAYILGFLASDGTVRKNANEIKVSLNAKDSCFLESIKNELHSDKDIKFYTTSDGFDCCTFSFTSKTIKEDLSKYNIVPAKTFTFKFPTNLSRKYWIDFIRGYFDGDGSISTAGTGAIKWQISSATEDVLIKIVDFFYEEYGIPKVNIIKTKRIHDFYNISYSTNATRKIYQILYTENSLFLPRKKEKYESILKNFNK